MVNHYTRFLAEGGSEGFDALRQVGCVTGYTALVK